MHRGRARRLRGGVDRETVAEASRGRKLKTGAVPGASRTIYIMPMRLSSDASDFESQFAALLGQKREVSTDIDDAVRAIIADVRTRGDAGLAELTLKYRPPRSSARWLRRYRGGNRIGL